MQKLALFSAALLLLIATGARRASALAPADQPAGAAVSVASADAPAAAPRDAQPTVGGGSADAPALPAVAMKRKEPSAMGRHPFSVAATTSILGFGADVATPLTRRSNLRVGFSIFNYNRGFSKDGVNYGGQLGFRSVQATYDWFPFGGGFHLSPGALVYNGNKVTASAAVPAGQSFTLGGVNYISSATDPLTGSGKIAFNRAAPLFLIGFGNLLPRSGRHFGVSFDIGAAYQGTPRATLNLAGSACDPTGVNCRAVATDPTIQSNIQSEQGKINNTISPFRFFPVVSLAFGYRF